MNHWLFMVSDLQTEDGPILANEVVRKRLSQSFWGLSQKAKNKLKLKSGDKIVFYIGGTVQELVASSELQSKFQELTVSERERLVLTGTSSMPEYGVYLKDSRLWPKPVKFSDPENHLSFIKDPEKKSVYMQGAIHPLTEKEFAYLESLSGIVPTETRFTHKEARSRGIVSREFLETGFYLSRVGRADPPVHLKTSSWKDAYLKFYPTLGSDRSEREFLNSLKIIRDTYDSHVENSRIGWLDEKTRAPIALNEDRKAVYDELISLSDDELWERVRPYAVVGYNAKESSKREKKVKENLKFFSSEFHGVKSTQARAAYEAEVWHGEVVDALKEYVEKVFPEAVVYNTVKIDLAVEELDTLTRIYEVKTGLGTQTTYTAVGQLFMHTAGAPKVERWIVLPGPIENEELISCFKELGVQLLQYKKVDGVYEFFG